MTITIRRKRADRYIIRCLLSCCMIGCSLLIATGTFKHYQSVTCVPITVDHNIADRPDEWKYQNSITSQWYQWTTLYKKQGNDTEWTVKWLNTPPTSLLGVIVYLTSRYELTLLNRSLLQLSRLLINNPRPVVIFHEGDFSDNDIQQSLAHTLGPRTPLGFQRIQFAERPDQSKSGLQLASVEYLHMCRFFIVMLPNHPLLTLFSYYWRLDTHSYIFGPNPIRDPFEIMQQRNIQYAYIMANTEGEGYAIGLWSFFHQFLNDHCLKPSATVHETQTNPIDRYSLAIIFTNFAIANASLFRDHPMIRTWLQTVDRNGGIYRHRWGDAPVHTLALTQFIQRNQIVRLRYFGYMHRREYVCANGIEGARCKEQVQPWLTDPRTEYLNYDDGCWPSSQNPLCHYYSVIRQ